MKTLRFLFTVYSYSTGKKSTFLCRFFDRFFVSWSPSFTQKTDLKKAEFLLFFSHLSGSIRANFREIFNSIFSKSNSIFMYFSINKYSFLTKFYICFFIYYKPKTINILLIQQLFYWFFILILKYTIKFYAHFSQKSYIFIADFLLVIIYFILNKHNIPPFLLIFLVNIFYLFSVFPC